MSIDGRTNDESWQRKTVGSLLDSLASRAQSRRCNVRTTEVVNNDSYNEIRSSCDTLAQQHRLCIVTGLTHLSCEGKEKGRASVGKDDGRERCHRVDESRFVVEFPV